MRKFLLSVSVLLFIISLVYFSITQSAAQTVPWHDLDRKYRVKLTIQSNIPVASGKPLELNLNFSQILQQAGQSGTANLNSLKLIETNSQGGIVNPLVPFQFDITNGTTGKFIYLSPEIAANTAKNYYLYFDTGPGFSANNFTPQVTVADNINFQGQSSFRLTTSSGTYYYHKAGAGFAGFIDRDGIDWISYRPTVGSAGSFRGIPNMVHPEGFFHPGSTGSVSQIVNQGPLKATINSTNGSWSGSWEIYPTFARMTLTSVGHSYWFLYEGTPNGTFNPSTNFMISSNNERYTGGQEWANDLPSPEWLYFSDTQKNRSLFLSHLEDDNTIDSYKSMQNNMTVFGFGRDGGTKYLTAVPSKFLFGFIETNVYTNASRIINSFSQNTNVGLAALEIRSGNITPSITPSITVTPTAVPTLTNAPPTSTIAPGATSLNSIVFLHGIGRGGDNANPGSLGTQNPLRTTRTLSMEIYNATNQLVAQNQGIITYIPSSGKYQGLVSYNNLATGIYTVKVKVNQYLKKNIPGIVNVTSGQVNNLLSVYLITGDTNNDNALSILDYNMILDCYSGLSEPRDCSDVNKKSSADITDDGAVNQFDYNLFLRELSSQPGE